MWTDLDLGISRAALWTESTSPLPPIPLDEYRNKEAVNTIINNPHLFKIVTPINTPQFKELLSKHPNQPFVNSVVDGLTHGFWPFTHTNYGTYPTTLDDSGVPPKTPEQISFLSDQVQTESNAGRYSIPFGPDLLPGMYSTPILAVPRKGKLCLCNHQSHGEFSLNSMMKRDDIAGVKLDGIRKLGESLHLFRHQYGDKCLVLFKSDIKAAFFFKKSLFYFYWGVALCWKLKLQGVCMYVGFLCLCRCRAWSMTTRCKSRCGEVYACEANGWWCQVGCGRGGPGVVVSTIGAVGIRGGSVTYVVYIYISGRSRWVK